MLDVCVDTLVSPAASSSSRWWLYVWLVLFASSPLNTSADTLVQPLCDAQLFSLTLTSVHFPFLQTGCHPLTEQEILFITFYLFFVKQLPCCQRRLTPLTFSPAASS